MKVNDVVKIKPNSKYYDNKIPIPNHIINDKWIVMSIKGDRVVIDKNTSGTKSICSTVNIENLEVIEDNGYVGRNMHISSVGLNLIMDFEGCSLDAYRCPAGVWTIGYGHIENVHRGDHITKQQAVDIEVEPIPETVVRKDSEDKNTSKRRSTKRFGKKIMRSRCRNISYGTIQELSRSIQTAYYAELSEKQKIQQVIRSAQEKAEEIQY